MEVKDCIRKMHPVQLYIILISTSIFFLIQLIASYITHSLTLLLNAYHMLCNIIALVGCIASMKKFHSDKYMKSTFGWARIDIVTMLVCCIFLASFCFCILMESLQTLIHINHLDAMHYPIPVMTIGATGILLNLMCYILIGGYTMNPRMSLSVTKQGQFILHRKMINSSGILRNNKQMRMNPLALIENLSIREIFRDISGCLLVILDSILVYFTDSSSYIARFVDPILAIVSSLLLFTLSYPYMERSGLILLQTIPNHINIESLKRELLESFPGIINVYDLHIWQLAGENIVSTVHIIFRNPMVYARINDEVETFFIEMGITQVTLQPEFQKVQWDHY